MSGEVPRLRDASSSPVPEVVIALEQALEKARSGALRNVVIVGDLAGDTYYANCGMSNRVLLLGYLEIAKQLVAIPDEDPQ